MGNCSSKSKSVAKDPADKSLEEIKVKDTSIAQFDEVFKSVSETGNYIVDLNNNIFHAQEKVKELATLLLGAYQIMLSVGSNSTQLKFEYVDADGVVLGKRDWMSPDLDALDCSFVHLKDALNHAMLKYSAATLEITKKGTLKLAGELEESDKQHLLKHVRDINLALFPIKQELMKVSLKDAVSLSKALKASILEIQKQASNMKPRVNINTDGIAEGEIQMSVDLGLDFNKIGGKPKKIWDALMSEEDGDTGLIPTLINAVKEIPSINEKVTAVSDAVKNLPQEPSALQSACTDAGISPLKIPSTIKIIGTNIKQSAAIPSIVATFIDNLRSIATEIKDGFTP
jgi:hypothetical protein